MNDLISRQEAIDALESSKDKTAKGDIGGFYNAIIQNDIDRLRNLPSAQLEQQWVPCSERLPEDGRPVLIYAWNVHYVIARYDSFRTENGYKNTWVTADAWNGNTEIEHDVIAWMPLPEPYHSADMKKAK